jgi:polysaccharide biosynthesis/export protein
MKFFCWICFIVALIVFSTSCATRKRLPVNYLENLSDTTIPSGLKANEATIRKNDILSIRVYSMSIDPSTDIPYNLPEGQGTGANNTTTGFLVDQNGNIEYPRIGTVKAEGLTKEELAEVIKSRLQDQLKQPSVMVRFINYRITVLGEVRGPGTFSVPSERITILEALGMAGDVSEFGKRSNVKVMRESSDGQRTVGTIDLTSSQMFNSPFYTLQQNDVVFVDQSDKRTKQQDQQQTMQQIGIATSLITVIALVLNFIK